MNDTPAGKWTHLVQLANASQHPLQLLIGASADAACASRSLVRLLRNNRVRFEAMPVSTAEQMQAVATANLEASMEEDPRHVYLLVGCGAGVDLTAVFDMNRLGAIFVLDAQRPLHLANMRSDRVIVWNEAAAVVGINRFFAHHNRKTLASRRRRRGRTTSRQHAAPVERRAKAHRHDGDDFSDATSDTDASESDDWHSDSASSADPENPNDDAASSVEGDAEDLDLGDGTTIDWRSEAVPGELERLYYSAAWHEQPAAITVHELAVAVGQQHEAILWGASVGLADTLKRRGISTTAYEVELDKLAEAVSQMAATRRTLIGNALTDVTTNENGEQRAGACAWRLKVAYDPALFCLSHTSLQAALELDPVLAARLRVHRHADRNNNVSELFAHVGVSLQTAQRNWAELSSESRADTLRRLGEELVRLGFAEASLQLTRRVVSRVVGFGVEVSPFDACTLFYAEASRPRKASVAQAGTEALVEHYRRQFWEACKVIDAAPHTKEFGDALDEALHVSEVATQVTAEVMQPGGVVATQLVHYTMLGERGGGQAVRALAHPARMALLAEHVMEALAVESKRHQRRRPLIVGAPCANPALSGDNECVVVCTTPHFESATHVEPVVGEFQGAVSDLEDPVPTSFLQPMVAGVTGRDAALGFLEAVHLRLAR